MQPMKDKFNDDCALMRKWVAGTGDSPYPGEALSVQHFLCIMASKTNITFKDLDDISRCDIRTFSWLVAAALDIRAIGHLPARWVLRDSTCAKALLLLLEQGGLTYTGASHQHESCLHSEIGTAAKKVKKLVVLPEDVIVLDAPETGTWVDEAVTKDVTPIDGSACAYFQFRNTTGHFLSKEQAQEMSGIFKDIPQDGQAVWGHPELGLGGASAAHPEGLRGQHGARQNGHAPG